MTIGKKGPVALQDYVFLDEMAHFDRERIPERVVHAKGAGILSIVTFTNHIQIHTIKVHLVTLKSHMTFPSIAKLKSSVVLVKECPLLLDSQQLVSKFRLYTYI